MKRIDKPVEPTIQLEFDYQELRLIAAALWYAYASSSNFVTGGFTSAEAVRAYRKIQELAPEVGDGYKQ